MSDDAVEAPVTSTAEEVPAVETNQDAEGVEEEDAGVAEVEEDDPRETHTPGSEPFSRATQMQ